MHLQPRPKSASGTPSSSGGFKGLYSPYGFLPDKVQTEIKQPPLVQLFGDTRKGNTQPLQSTSRPSSSTSRALVSYGAAANGNTNIAVSSMMQIENLEMEMDSTKAKLSRERELVGDLEGQVDSLTLQVSDLKEQLKSKSWAVVEKDRSLKEAEYKNECMAEEGQAMLEEMKNENRCLKNDIIELREVVVSWERRWSQAEAAMEESEDQLKHAEKRNANLELKISESKLDMKIVHNLVEEKEIENASLRKRNSDLENQIVVLSKKLRTGK
jgi:chromosome segregation ATPase